MPVEVKRIEGPGLKKLQTLIKGLGKAEGKVGWFDNAQYENGTPVAYIASINEFGSPANKIPPRSFMRSTALEERQNWKKLGADGAKGVLSGALTPDQAMLGVVTQAKGDIQSKIATIREPALSPITLGLRKVKLGRVPGLGPNVTGRTVGIVAAMISKGTLKTTGVSDKPLIEPAGIPGGGTLYTSIDARVDS